MPFCSRSSSRANISSSTWHTRPRFMHLQENLTGIVFWFSITRTENSKQSSNSWNYCFSCQSVELRQPANRQFKTWSTHGRINARTVKNLRLRELFLLVPPASTSIFGSSKRTLHRTRIKKTNWPACQCVSTSWFSSDFGSLGGRVVWRLLRPAFHSNWCSHALFTLTKFWSPWNATTISVQRVQNSRCACTSGNSNTNRTGQQSL